MEKPTRAQQKMLTAQKVRRPYTSSAGLNLLSLKNQAIRLQAYTPNHDDYTQNGNEKKRTKKCLSAQNLQEHIFM